jgi:hypothetical protein
MSDIDNKWATIAEKYVGYSGYFQIIFRSLFFQNPYDLKTVLNYLSIQVLSTYYDLEEIIYVLCLTCIFSKLYYNKII